MSIADSRPSAERGGGAKALEASGRTGLPEAALRDHEPGFRALAQATSAAIFIYQGTRLLYVNPATEQLTGYSREELLSMDVWQVAHPDFREMARERVLARQRGEPVPTRYELKVLTKDGQERWLDLSAAPFSLEGRPAVIGAAFDVTERKLAKRALRAGEERYRLIVDTANEGIWMLDQEGRVEFVNRAIAEMFGYEPDAMVGRPVSDFMDEDAREEARWRLERCHQGIVQKFDFPFRRSDGSRLWAHVSCTPVPNDRGVFDLALAMLVDVTDRRQAEEVLKEREVLLRALLTRVEAVREEERTRIARQIHDELGQSLTVLRMELSRMQQAGDRGAADLGARIEPMLGIVDSTMESVRHLSTELRPVVLDAFGLKAALRWEAQKFSRRTGIPCRLESRGAKPAPHGDRSVAVFRIFQEALTNVARHAGATTVWITLEQDEREISLVIEDDGVGIPDAKLSEATALGLLGMRERALAVGGRIAFDRRSGGGTRVHLRVPLETSD